MDIITLFDIGANLAAAITGLFFLRTLNPAYKFILAQVFAAFIVELVCATVYKSDNVWIYNIYMIADCCLLSLAAFYLLNKSNRLLFCTVILTFLIFWLNAVWIGGIKTFAKNAFIIYSIHLVIQYITIMYRELVKYKGRLYKFSLLWICAGLVIFYSCIIPYLSKIELQSKLSHAQKQFLHILIDILNQLRYVFIAIGFFFHFLGKKDKAYNER